MDEEQKNRICKILKDKFDITRADQITPEIAEKVLNPKPGTSGIPNRILGIFVCLKQALMTETEVEEHKRQGPWVILPR